MSEPTDKELYERMIKVKETQKENILEYGMSVMGIQQENDSEGKAVTPCFSYSVGISKTLKAPEVIFFGIPFGYGKMFLDTIYAKIKKEGQFPLGKKITQIANMPVVFLPVSKDIASGFMYQAKSYYAEVGGDWEAIQLVFPDKNGKFDWEEGSDPSHSEIVKIIGDTSVVNW